MESGNIVEYIDRQKIMCAVVLETKNQRLRVLTENNRESKIPISRLTHKDNAKHLDLSIGRNKLVETLKETSSRRRDLIQTIEIKELWEVLNTEQEWIDLPTMASFCFSDDPTGDHESAVVRAFFHNRIYFKFDNSRFFPNSEEHVNNLLAQQAEAERKERIIKIGGDWLRSMSSDNKTLEITEERAQYIEILKSLYIFEKESPYYDIGKSMIDRAGIALGNNLFQALVKLNVWDENENIELIRNDIPVKFSKKVRKHADNFMRLSEKLSTEPGLRDLTGTRIITIDGQSTLDYDDALSIEDTGDVYKVGVHISDVAHYVRPDDPVDHEASNRASSIYMPDQKIPMLPQTLAEGMCSLRAEELRPAITTMVTLSKTFEIIDTEVFPSLIRVTDQLSYYEVNMMIEEDKDLIILHEIARKFREKRLNNRAVHISLPEVSIWLNENNEIVVNKTNRESPGRLLVSELMIMANWLMGRFLADNGLPAIFRSQPDPKERLYEKDKGTLFQNWMQRRFLSRFSLGVKPEQHSGLGLDSYITATSPIRKYSDLITQRQIRSVYGLERAYTEKEIQFIIHTMTQPMSLVSRTQFRRKRYWLLKYLEDCIGQKEEALVLGRRNNNYQALLPEYMIECNINVSSGMVLKPEDTIQVTIQHSNARKDILSLFVG